MASVKFLIQSKKNPANIYIRLSICRSNVIKRKTGYSIDPKKWSVKAHLPKQSDDGSKEVRNKLGKLANHIETNLNKTKLRPEEIPASWFEDQIDSFHNRKKKTELDRIINYIEKYIEKLPYKVFSGGKTGVTHNTIQKYTTLRKKIEEFETHKGKRFFIKDVGLEFGNELTKYFLEVDKLSPNSTGRYVKYLKTACNDAKENGIETHPTLKLIKGITGKSPIIYLTLEELEKIEKTSYDREALNNAKDWLLIGCYIGQRVSDLLILTSKNIHTRNEIELIELRQKKTGHDVSIPIPPIVKELLNKRNGKFPEPISDQKFNKHIKDICKIAEISQLTEGGKMSKKTKRKEFGVFPKHELITTHVCRRSFASNFYGKLETPILMSITGHKTEGQFLQYIGKKPNDFAEQIKNFWNNQ